jgi:signal transduction histidine kinase
MADQRRLLQIVHAEVLRLRRLVEQWLSPSGGSEAPSPSQETWVALHPLLSRAVQAFEMQGTGHRFVVSAPEDLPLVWGDAGHIQQIVSNLVQNAVQYSPPGTQITLLAEAYPDEILIEVRDQGPGVPPEDRPRLFEPFFRGEHLRKSTEGHGMGLPIAKSLAQQLGGDLSYDDKAVEGACLLLTLPRT